MADVKMCGRCRTAKPKSEFHRRSEATIDGRQAWCKPCSAEVRGHRHGFRQQIKTSESRQIHARIPAALHAQLRLRSERNGRSLSNELVQVLRAGLAVLEAEEQRARFKQEVGL